MIDMLAVLGTGDTPAVGVQALSMILIIAFAALAGYDGVNLHLVRYRLWARAESKTEHLVHTARSILFPAILLLVFTGRTGPLLWLGIAVVVIDTIVEAADVAIEPASRANLGGLPATEALIHNVLGVLRTAALAAAFLALPTSAYRWSGAPDLEPAGWTIAIVVLLAVAAVPTAIVHIWLATRPLDQPAITPPAPPIRTLETA